MCNKQCRDENGFKCHLTSESHKRQMDVFGQNPNRVIHDYSREFEKTFLDHLRRSHPFSRVAANVVYNEFIQDRHHVHMNATRWLSLTEFVKYLGREGKCKVDETPKGWFITLIQEDPFVAMEKKKKREREKSEKEADERHLKVLQAQAARAKNEVHGVEDEKGSVEDGNVIVNKLAEQPLKISIHPGLPVNNSAKAGGPKQQQGKGIEFDDGNDMQAARSLGTKRSKVEQLMQQDLLLKKRRLEQAPHIPIAEDSKETNDTDGKNCIWIVPNIVVKVLSPSLKEHGYYKKKGRILSVEQYLAEIEMIDSRDILRVDQEELETVVPTEGKQVMILRGPHKGETGKLESLEKDKFGANISVSGGKSVFLEYEYFSKI
jgi:DNA/RNA-binding protein KIN17